MCKIVLTEDLKIEAEKERQQSAVRAAQWQARGCCGTCGVDLKTHLDSGILLCAHTHRKQYEDFCREYINDHC